MKNRPTVGQEEQNKAYWANGPKEASRPMEIWRALPMETLLIDKARQGSDRVRFWLSAFFKIVKFVSFALGLMFAVFG